MLTTLASELYMPNNQVNALALILNEKSSLKVMNGSQM